MAPIRPAGAWRVLLLAVTLMTAPGGDRVPGPWAFGAAFAQDDGRDDDGGFGGDDRGDDGGGDDGEGDDDADDRADDGRPAARDLTRPQDNGLRSPSRRETGSRVARIPQPVARPRPDFAPGEIVVTNLDDADLAALLSQGFTMIERVDLTNVAVVLHRLQVPGTLALEAALDLVRAQPTGATGDFNHFYRSEQETASPAALPATQVTAPVGLPAVPCTHLNCAAFALIGWPATRDAAPECRVTVPVGVIDTGVNAEHENLAGADLEVLRLTPDVLEPSKAVHGTAVASLLIGQRSDRAPGLIPEARLIVVDIFGRDGSDERASVAALVQALDLLAERQVKVINLSLAGPPNAALEAALGQITIPGGAVVLAASGNGGPTAEPAYPAGYPSVIAVTAVDQRGQIYRRAQRGGHLDLAAPGVEVWSATSVSGVKPKTGTSFAVPFATAAAAVLASRDPAATPQAIAARLGALVRDIGATGPDEVFGAGLLSLETLCAPQMSAQTTE